MCTAPGSGLRVVATACTATRRSARSEPSLASGRPSSKKARAWSPKSLTWSMVCGAPQAESSKGRSADRTSSGTWACPASITAGR